MLFNLIKKAYELKKEEKSYLNENFKDILSILNNDTFDSDEVVENIASGEHPLFVLQEMSKKKKKRFGRELPVYYKNVIDCSDPAEGERLNDPATLSPLHGSNLDQTYVSGNLTDSMVKVANLYDPETPQQMLNLVNVMERFINIDDDISHSNMGVFLYPLSRGAKRLAMRPAKIVGLTKDLWFLSRQFDRMKNMKDDNIDAEGSINKVSELDSIKNQFRDRISSIKTKISAIMQKQEESKENVKKPLDVKPLIDNNENIGIKTAFENKVNSLKKQGWSVEAIKELKPFLSYDDTLYKNL